jgi:hypothetical protein
LVTLDQWKSLRGSLRWIAFGEMGSTRERGERTKKSRSLVALGVTPARYTHPRVFFVRVANKGLMLDAARKSGKCRA